MKIAHYLTSFKTPFERNAFFILTAYIISCAIEGIFTIPLAGNIIQLPEVIFLLFASYFFININKIKWREFKFIRLDFALFAYALAVLLSWISSGKNNALGEVLGITYFLSFYFMCNIIFRPSQHLYSNAQKLAFTSAATAGFFGLIGWLLLYFFDNNSMAWLFPNYPILGDTIRVKGFIRGPIILADFLAIGLILFLLWCKFDYKSIHKKWRLAFLLILAGLIMTKTKSILVVYFILAGAYLKLKPSSKRVSWFLKSSSWMTLIIYLITSHVFFIEKESPDFQQKLKSPYSSCQAYETFNKNWMLIPSVYSSQKALAVIAGIRHIPFGIGGNQLILYNREIHEEGILPCHNTLTPHSTYFGAFGELGIFGLCMLLILLITIYQTIQTSGFSTDVLIVAMTLYLYLLLQAITTDVMNFRHYWLLLVFLAIAKRQHSSNQ